MSALKLPYLKHINYYCSGEKKKKVLVALPTTLFPKFGDPTMFRLKWDPGNLRLPNQTLT